MKTAENIYEQVLLAYEQRNFDFIEVKWRELTAKERLNIICKAYRDGERHLLRENHFTIFPGDIKIIQDKKMDYAEKFELSSDKVRELYWWNKPRVPSANPKHEMLVRNIAMISKLEEYDNLIEKYGDYFTLDLLKNNPQILKCDSRRTESRIKFLLEQNDWQIPKELDLATELTMQTGYFNFKHQKEMQEILERIDKSSLAYEVVADLAVRTPDYANDKFLELALRVVYGDNDLLSLINKRYEQKIAMQQKTSEESKLRQEAEEKKSEKGDKVVISDDVKSIDELFEDAFPADNIGAIGFSTSGHSLAETKPNNRENLNEKRIEAFLQELHDIGITCEGYITSNSGMKALYEEQVRYYVLKKGNYRILEPIGQVGNRTIVLRNGETIETLRELLSTNTKAELIRNGYAVGINHKRTEDQSYHYSANRLQNMIALIDEFSGEKTASMSLDDIRSQITKLISQEEIPEISKYIWELSKHTAIKLAKYIVSNEQKANDLRNDKPQETSAQKEDNATLSDSTAKNAEEVDI